MALFTDGPAADIEYLRSYESGILDVASTEGIDVTPKLALAGEQIADVILHFLLSEGTREMQPWRLARGVSDVVVTPALRRWVAVKTLELMYRDAYGHQLNDRYGQKLQEYAEAARSAADEYFLAGVGLVSQPIPKSTPPSLVSAGAADQPGYVSVSWTGTNGAEGAPSDAVGVDMGAGAMFTVPVAPSGVSGWKLYGGPTATSMILQTPTPVACGSTWTFTGTLNKQGAQPGTGQAVDWYVIEHRGLRRG